MVLHNASGGRGMLTALLSADAMRLRRRRATQASISVRRRVRYCSEAVPRRLYYQKRTNPGGTAVVLCLGTVAYLGALSVISENAVLPHASWLIISLS